MNYEAVRAVINNHYLLKKCMAIVPGGIGLICMLGAATPNSAGMAIPGLLAFAACWYMIATATRQQDECLAQFANFEQKSSNWYRSTYPEFSKNGRVTCRHCGSHKISIRGLGRNTFHREHVCVECGKTLYYSPEQNT
jgi:DNA-directed RNA polymerase subunit RPC12/RpoP